MTIFSSKKKKQQTTLNTQEQDYLLQTANSINDSEPLVDSKEKKSPWSFAIPKKIWDKKENDNPVVYERVKTADNVVEPGQNKETEKHETWLKMDDVDRTTSSMKWSDEIEKELITFSEQDIKSDKLKPNGRAKTHINNILQYSSAPKKIKELKNSFSETVDFLKELKNDLTKLQIEKDPVKLNKVTEEFSAKYNDLSEDEIDILSTYSAILLSEQTGNLDLDNVPENEIIDATDDSKFVIRGKKLDTPIKHKDNNTYDTRLICYGKDSDFSKMPLFSHEPKTTDIKQGEIGACYFYSAINAIIESDPNLIKDMMRDEGKTVVCRFFDYKGKPVYVRINKTVPHWYYHGKTPTLEPAEIFSEYYGATGALWLKYLEKAYSIVRKQVDDPKYLKQSKIDKDKVYPALDILGGGLSEKAIKLFVGNKIKVKTSKLKGLKMDVSTVKISKLYETVRNGEKSEFFKNEKKNNPKVGMKEWNIYRAKTIFGVDIKDENDPFYALIKDNSIFKKFETFLSEQLKNFSSLNQSLKDEAQFHSILDLNYFITNLKLEEMPSLNIDGIDEEKVKKQYLSYFIRRVMASGLLKNYVNMTGKYSKSEMDIFNKLSSAVHTKNKKILSASTPMLWSISKKKGKGEGLSGEVIQFGIAGKHEYSIIDTKEKKETINGKEVIHRFVVIQNPWLNNVVREYDKDTGLAYGTKYDSKDTTVHGTFEMELTDFINTFDDYTLAG